MKTRLDLLLIERGFAIDQKTAGALIMSGQVFSQGKKLNKAGMLYNHDIHIEIKAHKPHNWVSRGGIKLSHALKYFAVNPAGSIAMDVGCAIGGFTEVLLSQNTKKIFAIDVGYGEFDWKLRNDNRVCLLERTNVRYISRQEIPDPVDLIVCDVSFISLTTALPAALSLAGPGAWLVALIKPQFEVAKHEVGKGGIVRNPELHQQVIDKIQTWLTDKCNWQVIGVTESPITGTEGNKEFFIGARKPI